ncbi:hypothetical protein BJ875DRAFT_117646 [Amylocarpus encephaloides]|uniref:Uncharacterized protein n=1 Tax=Amylocarpus encephaloides TaxID=45428 RepID=A0A9P8C2X2_9HELO|nr:hypothetical protein BJ875DRAFT_117646 [Amylocarpus encephaloides]
MAVEDRMGLLSRGVLFFMVVAAGDNRRQNIFDARLVRESIYSRRLGLKEALLSRLVICFLDLFLKVATCCDSIIPMDSFVVGHAFFDSAGCVMSMCNGGPYRELRSLCHRESGLERV